MSLTNISIAAGTSLEALEDHYTRLASDEAIARAAQALTEHGMRMIIAETREGAKEEALKLIPIGTQVFTVSSKTTSQLGLTEVLDESGQYDSVRKLLKRMGQGNDRPEMRKAASSPDLVVGSVQAITQDGIVLDASMTGSQLPAYAAGAEKVIWIAGAQKIVKDVQEGLQRIYEYCLPLENQRTMEVYGVPSEVNKILIVNREQRPGRITMILVKEQLGF